jgi:hydrogenase expression/formation protein HypD
MNGMDLTASDHDFCQPPRSLAEARDILREDRGPRLNLMEVCGTHTAAIARRGLRSLLPPSVRLVSGPGCPVCVTPAAYIDQLAALALRPAHLVLCFGDLIRVPGHRMNLSWVMARGGKVRMIYAPLEALTICRENPALTVVLAAVGFETTAPAFALLVKRAKAEGIGNLRLLLALRRMPPALELLCSPHSDIDGFLAPGHVSAILGSRVYEPFAARYGKPFVVAGFTPEEVLLGIARLVQLGRSAAQNRAAGRSAGPAARVENLYPAVVRPEGNQKAKEVLAEVFCYEPAPWRGLGVLPDSGFGLREAYAAFDAGPVAALAPEEDGASGCRCGELMLGTIEPSDCPLFGKACRPDHPVGPCMVSAEGACGIHYRFLKAGTASGS